MQHNQSNHSPPSLLLFSAHWTFLKHPFAAEIWTPDTQEIRCSSDTPPSSTGWSGANSAAKHWGKLQQQNYQKHIKYEIHRHCFPYHHHRVVLTDRCAAPWPLKISVLHRDESGITLASSWTRMSQVRRGWPRGLVKLVDGFLTSWLFTINWDCLLGLQGPNVQHGWKETGDGCVGFRWLLTSLFSGVPLHWWFGPTSGCWAFAAGTSCEMLLACLSRQPEVSRFRLRRAGRTSLVLDTDAL